jgi:hypothetical protein
VLEAVELAVEREGVLGPEPAHQHHLFGLPPTAGVEVLVQGVVLDGVPADPDAESQPVPGQHRDLGGLLGHQHGLALRQDQHGGDELDPVRARGEEPEQHERLVERGVRVVRSLEAAGPVPVDADHVVVHEEVGHAELLRALRERPHRPRVGADLVMRDDRADLHANGVCQTGTVTKSPGCRRHRRHRRCRR